MEKRERKCVMRVTRERERERRGERTRVVVGETTSVAPTEREIFAKSRQVALVELCSYFPSTHPMMSTVM